MAEKSSSTPTIAARLSVKGTEQVKGAFGEIRRAGVQTFGAIRRQSRGVTDAVNTSTRNAGAAATASIGRAQVGLGTIGVTMLGLAGTAGTVTGILGEIGKKIFETTAALGAIGGGATALVATWASTQTQATEETLRQAKALGTSVEALSGWQAAIRLSGGQAESAAEIIGSLSTAMVEIRKGSEGADNAFRQLGIDVRKSNGEFKTTEELFVDTLDSLTRIKDQGLRASAAYDVFGGAAKDILPVLSKGSEGFAQLRRDAERYGTTLSSTQAEAASDLMAKQRRMMEAVRGTSTMAAEIIMPFVADAMEALGKWLIDNRQRIRSFIETVVAYLVKVRNDLTSLFSGKGMIELPWVRALIGPLEWLKGIVADIGDALSGSPRRTWLTSMGNAARQLWLMLGAVLGSILGIEGANMAPMFDVANAFDLAAAAFESFRIGIEGGIPPIPWAGELGRGFKEFTRIIGAVGQAIYDNREVIGDFATTTLYILADGLKAIRQLMTGEAIDADSMFAGLNGVRDFVLANFGDIGKALQGLLDQFKGAGEEAMNFEFLGLDSGKLALIGLAATQIGGVVERVDAFMGVIQKFSGVIAGLLKGVGFFAKEIMFVIGGLATLLGIPVWAVALIVAAIAAAGVAIYLFWDEIVAFLGAAWESVVAVWNGAGDFLKAVWSAIGDGARAAWEAIVSVWTGAGDWFNGLFSSIGDMWNGFWGGLGNGARSAWDSITGAFGGMVDWFMQPIEKIKGMWNGLWDGIKNGAKGAWDWVTGWFGGGGDAADTGGTMPSYDKGTSRVPGRDGEPITATIHGGERIWTVEQNKAFGALLDTLESHTSLPETEFSQAPTAPVSGRSSSSSDLHPMPVNVGGRKINGLAGRSSAINELRSAIRRGARAVIAPQPRWV